MWIGIAAFHKAPVDPAPIITAGQYESLNQALAENGVEHDVTAKAEAERAVYKFSVIPGGAYDADELERALADPVVASHYANVDQAHIRTEVVPADRYVHVSYRKGNKIFWTKSKVLLRKGETILTDGTTQIRSRCGNCISEAPLAPTADDEPDVVQFDRLVDSSPSTPPITSTLERTLPDAPRASLGASLASGPSAGTSAPAARGGSGPVVSGLGSAGIGGGAGRSGSGGGDGGSAEPIVTATRSGNRQPDHETSPSGGPQGPGSGLTELPFSPGWNDLPELDDLLTPGPVVPGGPNVPNDPTGPSDPNGFPIGPNGPNDFPTGPNGPNVLTTSSEDPISPFEDNVVVPEPGTLMLVGGGVAVLLRRLRPRSR